MKIRIAALSAMFCAATAVATPTVSIDSVVQRWPWNNKVDITYTVTDGQESAPSGFYRIVFTATIGGNEYTIGDASGVHASASSGKHTVTWTLPSGIGTTDCSMVARIYSSDTPSGDDYMIIDLATGAVTYEGLLTQSLSNARYNNDASGTGGVNIYKTSKMVLRKIPCTAKSGSLENGSFADGYPTGDDTNYASTNGRTNWITKLDYYIGVFPVTQAQFEKVTGSNPSTFKMDDGSDLAIYRPVENVSYTGVRGTGVPTDVVTPNDSDEQVFVARLNGRTQTTSGVSGLDLPTELMYEIAQRAGATHVYSHNDTDSVSGMPNYGVGNVTHTYAVGGKIANAWGLYDTNGNVMEWCRDDNSRANLKDAPDPWTPASSGSATYYAKRGGAAWRNWTWNNSDWRASHRSFDTSKSWQEYGFRVAYIVR